MNYFGPVHMTPEKFENGVFTLKTHQMFSLHTKTEKFKDAAITCHFGFLCLRKLGQGNHVINVTSSSKSSFFKMLSVNVGVFKFLWLKSVFVKLPFHDGLVWMAGLTVEIKLRL